MQSISGTGALLLAGMALQKANSANQTVYLTSPTWPNHDLLFETMGFKVAHLPYYNPKTCAFDADAFLAGLQAATPGSAVVLHTCAHNPTGCDPSRAEWRQIADIVRARGLFPVFDSAYLGFNSGNVDEDAWPIRYFTGELRLEAAVCLSFSKSMGLYGERVGAVMFVAATPKLSVTLQSVLDNAQRATVSTPPVYGARIAEAVLKKPEIRRQWEEDMVTMSSRIAKMRARLLEELTNLKTPGSWEHIVKQTGMFGYLGITPAQVEYIESKSALSPLHAHPDFTNMHLTRICRETFRLHAGHVEGLVSGPERAQCRTLCKGNRRCGADTRLESAGVEHVGHLRQSGYWDAAFKEKSKSSGASVACASTASLCCCMIVGWLNGRQQLRPYIGIGGHFLSSTGALYHGVIPGLGVVCRKCFTA